MESRTAYIELILLGVLWGSIGVIVKHARVGAPLTAWFRMAIGFVVVVALMAASGKMRRLRLEADRGVMVLDGLLLGAHWTLMFAAFDRLTVATAILLVFAGPAFVVALVGPLLGERVERRTLASLALALAGMALIAARAWRFQSGTGVLCALGSALCFAGLTIAGKRLTRTYRPATILAWQLGIGSVVVAPFAWTGPVHGLASAMPALATLGVVYTGIAGFAYFHALTRVKAQHVGVLAYLEPATAVLYAWIFLHEQPNLATLAGGALIVLAGLNIAVGRPTAIASPEEPIGV